MSRQTNLAKNTLILSIGTILPKFGVFITLPILTGCLTKTEYGIFDLVFAVFSMILPIATLKINVASFRFLIDERGNDSEVDSIISNTLIFTTAVSVLTLIPFFFFIPGNALVRLLACVYMFVSLTNATMALFLRGLGNNLDYSFSSLVNASCKVLFIVILLWGLNFGLPGAIASVLLASASSMCFLTYKLRIFSRIDLSLFSPAVIKQMLAYSWPNVLNDLCWWVMGTCDRLLIVWFIGLPASAAYAVAHKIPGLLNIANGTFTMAWYENASLAIRDKDKSQYYTRMFKSIFDLMAGLLGLIIASTPILFAILVKGDYSDAYNQMPILFMASFFSIMNAFMAGIFVASKNMMGITKTTFIAAICNFVINISLIRFIGIYAASLSTVISYAIIGAIRMRDVKKLVNIHYDKRHIIFVVLFLTFMSGLCFVRNIYLDAANIIMSIIFFTANNKGVMLGFWRKSTGKLRKIFAK
ncbi:MAG: oligosaccharide flippase family protein [Synergistaceae bacterium]|nr:oligosaccharide flippase family protein [Synergistaceae bacterium]